MCAALVIPAVWPVRWTVKAPYLQARGLGMFDIHCRPAAE
jgi:hypothetical protein